MSIIQFLRIVWAYRILILATTVGCFAAGTLTVELVRPRYEAESRVMLDVIKPDPVTGQVMATAFLRAYTKTQIELVKDLQVARRVVDDLHWDRDAAIKREYRERNKDADLEFGRWAAQKIMAGANAKLIEGSNILEISYSSNSPEQAKAVADALRKAYVEMTLQSRQETARRNADWYESQASKAKAMLFQAESTKSAYERENGIVLQDDKVDIDSARLSALASQGSAPVIAPAPSQMSAAATAVIQLDGEITQAEKTLGPNHPMLLDLRRRRELLAKQAAQEKTLSSSAANAAMSAAQATNGMLEAQKAKVMAQRDKVERLRLMQDEIDLRRDQYNKSVARAAQLRQESDVAESGVIPLANAITPQTPVFPKKGLIIGASIPVGAGLGVLIALLMELFGRRVRSAEDLATAVGAPVLAIIHGPREHRRRLWSLKPRAKPPTDRSDARPSRAKAARA